MTFDSRGYLQSTGETSKDGAEELKGEGANEAVGRTKGLGGRSECTPHAGHRFSCSTEGEAVDAFASCESLELDDPCPAEACGGLALPIASAGGGLALPIASTGGGPLA